MNMRKTRSDFCYSSSFHKQIIHCFDLKKSLYSPKNFNRTFSSVLLVIIISSFLALFSPFLLVCKKVFRAAFEVPIQTEDQLRQPQQRKENRNGNHAGSDDHDCDHIDELAEQRVHLLFHRRCGFRYTVFQLFRCITQRIDNTAPPRFLLRFLNSILLCL